MATEQITQKQVAAIDNAQKIINDWGNLTFPGGDIDGAWSHFEAEVQELRTALFMSFGNEADAPGELADCLILLFQVAGHLGLHVGELIADKHEINTRRVWRFDPDAGFSRHVDSAEVQ